MRSYGTIEPGYRCAQHSYGHNPNRVTNPAFDEVADHAKKENRTDWRVWDRHHVGLLRSLPRSCYRLTRED